MKEMRWQDFLPIQPFLERKFINSGLHFSKFALQDEKHSYAINNGYLIIISTGSPCLVTRKTPAGTHTGKVMPNEIIVTPPTPEVTWEIAGKAQFSGIYLSVDYVQQVAGSIGIFTTERLISASMFQKKEPLIESLFAAIDGKLSSQEYHDNAYIEAMARTMCVHLLHTNLQKDLKRFTGYQRTLKYDQIERIRAYVMEHLDQQILSSDLAACVHISDYHFYRLFKRTTKMTPQQFVKKCRLERARFLIEKTPMTMLQISYQTGFSDQSHLSREFRAGFGISPRALREKILCNQNLSLAL